MAEQIRDIDIITTQKPQVSPLFSLPSTLEGASYTDSDNDGSSVDQSGVNNNSDPTIQFAGTPDISSVPSDGDPFAEYYDSTTDVEFTSSDITNNTDILATPQNMSIVSQTVRWGTDGSAVVDLVIQFDDVDGATDYEVRLAKH